MSARIQAGPALPDAYQKLLALVGAVEKRAADAGLDRKLLVLVQLRASQLNGCAFCLDLHSKEALKLGEDQRRLLVLSAWRETELYTEQERAALALTEAITKLSQTQDVPDDVYQQATAVFDETQYAVLVWSVGVINLLNRLGVTSRMELPA
ncbi:carboxymuconolactone decarboxylase family protein [Amycolatopsis nigrescens]|uniref:carboxymuconolactone decarboxylase family protein n=1 Tax=Amycolatopsis nigrescens TaxID=381445 RepID=UPI00035D98E3|nr:carboxymuconolactone decarboxylase family protein [Amycolatopsis nigrescens]